jgi:two-component system, NtrC family, nitrogen regulation response regulator NtrX
VKNARVLVVDDESNIRELLEEILSEEGYQVTTAADAAQARKARAEQDFDLILLDIWMPDTDGISLLREWSEEAPIGPVVMMSGHGTVDTAVEATRLGAVDFIEKPVSLATLLKTVERALGARPAAGERRTLVPPMRVPVGKSETMRSLRERVERIASHDAHTLFTGEPGSGREAFVRYLSGLSRRAKGPFVTVVGSELTDADARALLLGDAGKGLLERAAGGILYINEVGEMSCTAQQLLLAILEKGTYRSSGAKGERAFDARILCSAPPGFERSESFRRELFSHLGTVLVRVPPLRKYSEDVPELLRYYVELLVDSEGLAFRRFSVAAQNRLRNYPWPGNILELKNLVKSLLITGNGNEISLEEVERHLESDAPASEPLVKQDLLALPLREAREHFERAYLQQQLELCSGRVGQLAKRVGMERTHLYRKLRALGVDFGQTED